MIDRKHAAREVLKLPPCDVTVALWLTAWREFFPTKRLPATAAHDDSMLQPFIRAHGRKLLSAITALMAQKWAVEHRHQLKYLRQAWEKAVIMGLLETNVWAAVRLPRRQEPPGWPVPSLEQLETALANAHELGRWYHEFGDMCEVAAFTGARQGGLIALRHADIDLGAKRMTVTEKGGKTRTIVLTGRGLDAMARAIERRPIAPTVFRNIRNGDLDRSSVKNGWHKIRGDFPGPFHSLKHFAGTWLAAQGVDEKDIAIQLGHFDRRGRPLTHLARTVYVHPDHDEARARIEAALG